MTVQETMVQIDLGRDLKKTEIHRLLQSVPFPVEFLLGGRHRIRVKCAGAGEAVSTALILLRGLGPED